MKIEVLGTGCTKCNKLYEAAKEAVSMAGSTAEVSKVEGRKLIFRVWAEDEVERIGEGLHERIIVNVGRFDVRTQDKVARVNLKKVI